MASCEIWHQQHITAGPQATSWPHYLALVLTTAIVCGWQWWSIKNLLLFVYLLNMNEWNGQKQTQIYTMSVEWHDIVHRCTHSWLAAIMIFKQSTQHLTKSKGRISKKLTYSITQRHNLIRSPPILHCWLNKSFQWRCPYYTAGWTKIPNDCLILHY